MSIFVTGDSRPYTVNLTIGGEPFTIPPTATVKAAIVSANLQETLTPAPLTLSSTTPGSDWTVSSLVVKFPRSSTAGIVVQKKELKALLEVQITFDNPDAAVDGDDWTWHLPITLTPGRI